MTTARGLWIALGALAFAIILHAALPRHTWQIQGAAAIRFDRWTGSSVVGAFNPDGQWMPRGDYVADQRARQEARAEAEASAKAAASLPPPKPGSLLSEEAAPEPQQTFRLEDIDKIEPPPTSTTRK